MILRAHEAARELGAAVVAPDHLLLAALESIGAEQPAAAVLGRHSVSASAVRGGLGRHPRQRPSLASGADRIALCAESLRLLARADLRADHDASPAVRPEHIVLAALDGADEPQFGSAYELIERLGTDVRRLRCSLRRAGQR